MGRPRGIGKDGPPRTDVIAFRITAPEREKWKQLAAKLKLPFADLVRLSVREKMKRTR